MRSDVEFLFKSNNFLEIAFYKVKLIFWSEMSISFFFSEPDPIV